MNTFIMIGLLCLVLAVVLYLRSKQTPAQAERAPAANTATIRLPVAAPATGDGLQGAELIAVLTAAIQAYRSEAEGEVSIIAVRTCSDRWHMAGLQDHMNGRLV